MTPRRMPRWLAAGVTTIALVLAGAGIARADEITNLLDDSIDAAAEVMPLNVGGSGSTTLAVVETNGDGKKGCNLTGLTTLVVTVKSSSPGVASVSPSSITFGSCGATALVTVTALAVGDTTISLTQISNSTQGSFDLAPATFTVRVAGPSNTAPVVAVTGVSHGATYELGGVPPAGCSLSDAEDGSSTFAATLSAVSGPLAASGIGSQTATCSYTDAGGLSATVSATYTITDTTDPSITWVSTTPSANPEGWNDGPVTVTWSCGDLGGVVYTTVSQTVTTEGSGQSATGTCTDLSGNSVTDTINGINIDLTAPVLTSTVAPAPNAAGWNNTSVTVTWSCTDALSGVATVSSPQILGEGADQSASGSCSDVAGNSVTGEVTNIDVDLTAPAISWQGSIEDGSSFYFGSVPPAPTCTATDSLSGVDGACVVSGYSTATGQHTITATAYDAAGNKAEESRTYTVLAWTLKGFYQPVDMNGVWNTVKNGSTVPLKFEAFAGVTEITDPLTLGATFTVKGVACPSASAVTDDIELTTTGGTSLRYDTTAGQFIQNWQTPKKPGACYQVTMTAADGSSLTAYFKLK